MVGQVLNTLFVQGKFEYVPVFCQFHLCYSVKNISVCSENGCGLVDVGVGRSWAGGRGGGIIAIR